MRRLLLALLIAVAAAAAIWLGTHDSDRVDTSVTALLPAETLALVHLPDLKRARQQWRETDIYNLWREPAVQEFLRKPLANVPTAGAMRARFDQLEALGLQDAFLAITSWQENQLKISGGFRFNGSADNAEKVIGEWRARLLEARPGAQQERIEHHGRRIEVARAESVTIATVYADDWFLAGNDVAELTKLLDRADGRLNDAASTLAADSNYVAASKQMPNRYALFAYGRPDRYVERIVASFPQQNQSLNSLRAMRSIGAATSFDQGKIRDTIFVAMPKTAESELSRASLSLATAETFLYFATLLNFPQESTLPAPSTTGTPAMPSRMQQAFAALSSAGLTLADWQSAFGTELGVIGDWPTNARFPAILATLPVKDHAKADQLTATVTSAAVEGSTWASSEKDGVRYYSQTPANPLVPIAPTLALAADRLVIGLDRPSVEAAIDRSRSHASTLAASQTFTAAERLLPPGKQSFTYADTAMLYRRLDAALRPMLIMGAAFVPAIAQSVDLAKLPDPEAITKHLSPIVMSQSYEAGGYRTESIGPVSIFQAGLGIAAASGAAAMSYRHARSSGAGAVPSSAPGLFPPPQADSASPSPAETP